MEIKGTYTALVTPFKDEPGLRPSVDYESYEKLVSWQIESGVNGLVVLGSTGEASTLDDEEKLEIVKRTLRLASSQVPVVVGTTSNDTAKALEVTKSMSRTSVAAALIATPYYNKPTQEGLYQHFKILAEEGGLPIVLYDIPGRTASEFTVETIKRLSQFDNIIAIKDATGNLDKVKQVISAVENRT